MSCIARRRCCSHLAKSPAHITATLGRARPRRRSGFISWLTRCAPLLSTSNWPSHPIRTRVTGLRLRARASAEACVFVFVGRRRRRRGYLRASPSQPSAAALRSPASPTASAPSSRASRARSRQPVSTTTCSRWAAMSRRCLAASAERVIPVVPEGAWAGASLVGASWAPEGVPRAGAQGALSSVPSTWRQTAEAAEGAEEAQ